MCIHIHVCCCFILTREVFRSIAYNKQVETSYVSWRVRARVRVCSLISFLTNKLFLDLFLHRQTNLGISPCKCCVTNMLMSINNLASETNNGCRPLHVAKCTTACLPTAELHSSL